jgi:hypothetical protein
MSDTAVEFGGGDESTIVDNVIDDNTASVDVDGEAGAAPEASVTDGAAPQADADGAASTPPITPEIQQWLDQEVEARITGVLTGLAGQLEPQQQQGQQFAGQQQPGEVQLDPFDDNFGQNLTQTIAQAVQQAISPVTQQIGQQQHQQQTAEAQERLRDIYSDIKTREGEFTVEAAEALFPLYQQEAISRYGMTPRAAEYAAQQSAAYIRSIEQAAEKRGEERYKNQLSTLAGAPTDTGGGGANGVTVGPDAKDELDLARQMAARFSV